jgi:hypothetical protein
LLQYRHRVPAGRDHLHVKAGRAGEVSGLFPSPRERSEWRGGVRGGGQPHARCKGSPPHPVRVRFAHAADPPRHETRACPGFASLSAQVGQARLAWAGG